ncbi:MAG: hypothetical protein J0H99_05680, partial [Rhodospirillales bacterium]|nr:hypothetical protein [Rhodospirillales bacterium]
MSNFYPTLPEAVILQLRVVLNSLREKPDYLDQSPYTTEIRDFLKELNGRAVQSVGRTFDG